MAAIQEGVSGRYSSARVRLRIVRDAHQRSNRICSMCLSECRNICVTFRPAIRVAGLAGRKSACLCPVSRCAAARRRHLTDRTAMFNGLALGFAFSPFIGLDNFGALPPQHDMHLSPAETVASAPILIG